MVSHLQHGFPFNNTTLTDWFYINYFALFPEKEKKNFLANWKRPIGHIAHLRNISYQQTHLRNYDITLIKREKHYLLFYNWSLFVFDSPSPKDVWLKLVQWFWRIFLNFVKVFSLFQYCFPLERDSVLLLNKLKCPSLMGALHKVWSPEYQKLYTNFSSEGAHICIITCPIT